MERPLLAGSSLLRGSGYWPIAVSCPPGACGLYVCMEGGSKTSVTQLIQQLEAHLRVKLLNRTHAR